MSTIDPEQTDISPEPTGRTSRRTVLLGAGVVGAAAVTATLAACGDGSSSNADGGPTGSDTNIAKVADIPVGSGKIFTNQQVVITQPTAGTFKAFSAICTHQGCTVSSIDSGLIMCPCHGSEYSVTDGAVKRGPAMSALPAKQVTVANGEISVS